MSTDLEDVGCSLQLQQRLLQRLPSPYPSPLRRFSVRHLQVTTANQPANSRFMVYGQQVHYKKIGRSLGPVQFIWQYSSPQCAKSNLTVKIASLTACSASSLSGPTSAVFVPVYHHSGSRTDSTLDCSTAKSSFRKNPPKNAGPPLSSHYNANYIPQN